jgi:hypothetical protein
MMPEQDHEPLYMGSNGTEYTREEITVLEAKGCPECGEPLDSGCWIPTMTCNLECDEDCGFSIEYPYEEVTLGPI